MFVPRSRTRVWVVPFVAAALVVVAAGAAQAQATVQVVTSFDEAQGQNPEGIAINRTGSIFVSVSPLGDVWRIPPGSDDPQPFGHVDGITPGASLNEVTTCTVACACAAPAATTTSANAATNGTAQTRVRERGTTSLPPFHPGRENR